MLNWRKHIDDEEVCEFLESIKPGWNLRRSKGTISVKINGGETEDVLTCAYLLNRCCKKVYEKFEEIRGVLLHGRE